MKVKSILFVALVFVLLATACGTAATPTAAPAATAAGAATAAPVKTFRIAVVMPSATTDMAFSQSMWTRSAVSPEGHGRRIRPELEVLREHVQGAGRRGRHPRLCQPGL